MAVFIGRGLTCEEPPSIRQYCVSYHQHPQGGHNDVVMAYSAADAVEQVRIVHQHDSPSIEVYSVEPKGTT